MIRNINFGIKISSSQFNLLPSIYNQKLIDFVEIILSYDFKTTELLEINKLQIPYAIHLPTSKSGFDLGDSESLKTNQGLIEKINKFNEKFAMLNPICYIIHPESGNYDLSIKFLRKLNIKPLALENMPLRGIFGYNLIGYNPSTIKIFFDEIPDLEFCLDINHAIKSSISFEEDNLKMIKNFVEFKRPIIFHISGGNLNVEVDEHLHLNEGQYNIFEIKNYLFTLDFPVYLTFETPKNLQHGIRDDIKNMKIFKRA